MNSVTPYMLKQRACASRGTSSLQELLTLVVYGNQQSKSKNTSLKSYGNPIISFEELCAPLCQSELILDSRPIGLVSEGPNIEFLQTPARFFLVGKSEDLPSSQTIDDINNLNC